MRGTTRANGLSQGLMLLPQGDGALMIARKQTNLENLYPPTAEYDSAPVYRERTFQFRPTGGIGESVQSAAADRRYHYGINVWVTGGLFGKGPLVHPILPSPAEIPSPGDTRAMVRTWCEGRSTAGVTALFFIAKMHVYQRNGDDDTSQTVIRTRAAGRYPTDMVRFQGAYASPVDPLYVAWDDGLLEELNMAAGTWATCSLPAGFLPRYLEVVGDELWAADPTSSQIRKVTADPKIAGSWSGLIQVGTPATQITALRQTTNRLAIFKADGTVFTINGDGTDNDLFPGVRTTIDVDNGRTAAAWVNSLWFRSGRAWYQLDLQGGPVLTPRGPGRNLGNLSEVRGPVQCLAGWNTQMAFCELYNETDGNSYLLSYGSWVTQADPGSQQVTVSGTGYTFVDQYDGALKKWAGRKITSLFVSNVPTEARLYCGFLDGGYDWIKLVPYPLLAGGGSEYTLEESFVVLPLHHALFQSDNKHWTGASIFGPTMTPGNSVALSYRVTGRAIDIGSGPGGEFLNWGLPLTSNGMRANPERPIAGKALELKIGLHSTVTTETPTLEGLGLHERLVPAFRRDYGFSVNANEHVARRDGAVTRQSGVTVRRWMEQAASAPATITIELPDESVNDLSLCAYEEHRTPHSQRGGIGFAIMVQATQFTVITVYGTIGRTRGTLIGDTRGYTIASMRFF